MEDTVRNNAMAIANLLIEHKGSDTAVVEVKGQCSWADFFIITTVRSQAHMAGIGNHLNVFFKEREIIPLNPQKNIKETGWVLIDCGEVIIHLMEKEQREFYELEKLWFKSKIQYLPEKTT